MCFCGSCTTTSRALLPCRLARQARRTLSTMMSHAPHDIVHMKLGFNRDRCRFLKHIHCGKARRIQPMPSGARCTSICSIQMATLMRLPHPGASSRSAEPTMLTRQMFQHAPSHTRIDSSCLRCRACRRMRMHARMQTHLRKSHGASKCKKSVQPSLYGSRKRNRPKF